MFLIKWIIIVIVCRYLLVLLNIYEWRTIKENINASDNIKGTKEVKKAQVQTLPEYSALQDKDKELQVNTLSIFLFIPESFEPRFMLQNILCEFTIHTHTNSKSCLYQKDSSTRGLKVFVVW